MQLLDSHVAITGLFAVPRSDFVVVSNSARYRNLYGIDLMKLQQNHGVATKVQHVFPSHAALITCISSDTNSLCSMDQTGLAQIMEFTQNPVPIGITAAVPLSVSSNDRQQHQGND